MRKQKTKPKQNKQKKAQNPDLSNAKHRKEVSRVKVFWGSSITGRVVKIIIFQNVNELQMHGLIFGINIKIIIKRM